MWWGPTKAVYCSVNADTVIILFGGGGDTSSLFNGNEFIQPFCTQWQWGAKKLKILLAFSTRAGTGTFSHLAPIQHLFFSGTYPAPDTFQHSVAVGAKNLKSCSHSPHALASSTFSHPTTIRHLSSTKFFWHHPAPDTVQHSVVVGSKKLKILLALAFCTRALIRHLFFHLAPIQHQFFSGTHPAPYPSSSGTRHYPVLSSGGEQKSKILLTLVSCSRHPAPVWHHPAPNTIQHHLAPNIIQHHPLIILAHLALASSTFSHLTPIRHLSSTNFFWHLCNTISSTRHYPALSIGGEQKT